MDDYFRVRDFLKLKEDVELIDIKIGKWVYLHFYEYDDEGQVHSINFELTVSGFVEIFNNLIGVKGVKNDD